MGKKGKSKKQPAEDFAGDELLSALAALPTGWGDFEEEQEEREDPYYDDDEPRYQEERRGRSTKAKIRKSKPADDGRGKSDHSGWGSGAGDGWHASESGWDQPRETNWGGGGGGGGGGDWGTSHHDEPEAQSGWNNQASEWGQSTGYGWGDGTMGDDWSQPPTNTKKKKERKGGGKRPSRGEWGNGIDQQAMESYHKDLMRRLANAAPPPKGPEYGPLPSRTLKIARNDENGNTVTMVPEAPGSGEGFIRFVDSGGSALKPAENALYSRNRLARDRFHWLFSPTKDARVAELLNWIQHMSYGLATLGLHKFLETGERGALITNVEYRAKKSPLEPAFDYLAWPEANQTCDRVLQQSLAYFDPGTQVLVFVFLLSQSQNSMAIWRRKLTIPTSLRTQYAEAIQIKKEELSQRELVIRIDDDNVNPRSSRDPDTAKPDTAKAKKKWFRWAV